MMNVKNKLNVTPEAFAKAAALADAVGEEMLARLEWVTLQPEVVLDVGCGAGHCTGLLASRYPAAKIIALDADYRMLEYAKLQVKTSPENSLQFICSDASSLPLPDQSVDLVFANFVLPWVADIATVLREWRRVLRPEGLLVFTSLGPDTLQTWRGALGHFTIPDFIDMHEIGDKLVSTRFSDPVMDVEYYTLTYAEQDALFAELQASGMLVGDGDFKSIDTGGIERNPEGKWATTYEVVFGHAWGVSAEVDHVADEFGTVRIPLAHLRRR